MIILYASVLFGDTKKVRNPGKDVRTELGYQLIKDSKEIRVNYTRKMSSKKRKDYKGHADKLNVI
jgi:hypothetical protein